MNMQGYDSIETILNEQKANPVKLTNLIFYDVNDKFDDVKLSLYDEQVFNIESLRQHEKKLMVIKYEHGEHGIIDAAGYFLRDDNNLLFSFYSLDNNDLYFYHVDENDLSYIHE